MLAKIINPNSEFFDQVGEVMIYCLYCYTILIQGEEWAFEDWEVELLP